MPKNEIAKMLFVLLFTVIACLVALDYQLSKVLAEIKRMQVSFAETSNPNDFCITECFSGEFPDGN